MLGNSAENNPSRVRLVDAGKLFEKLAEREPIDAVKRPDLGKLSLGFLGLARQWRNDIFVRPRGHSRLKVENLEKPILTGLQRAEKSYQGNVREGDYPTFDD